MHNNHKHQYTKTLPTKWEAMDVNTSLLIIAPDILTIYRLKTELGMCTEIFPGWETLPYDHFSPHEDIISNRLSLLYRLAQSKKTIILVDVKTLMHRLPPRDYIEANSLIIETGEDVNSDHLRRQFERHGYRFVTKVVEHGEFAVRGSVIDIFPMGSKLPYRLDLFDTTIDSIRVFDVDTQRSLETIDAIKLLPAKEFPMDEEGIAQFNKSWNSYFGSLKTESPMYRDVNVGRHHPGVEYYSPLFFENTETLFDYLPSDSKILIINGVEKVMENFWREIEIRYEQLRHDVTRPILKPSDIFIKPENILQAAKSFCQIKHSSQFAFDDIQKEELVSADQLKTKVSPQKIDAIIRDLSALQINDPVVHIDYGVGRYLGLKKIQVDDHENEFLELEYANGDKLYAPITSLELISRYTGIDASHAPLSHLGSKQWEKTKRQAKEQIRDTAAELLEISAKRLNTKGFVFINPEVEYENFVKAFPFVATLDQEKAIEDVINDMTSDRLMDRLICGDVGFGKTEVAMRAAFLAAYNGKQTAILTPTTLLAKQHFTNFIERFASMPVKIGLFSRFNTSKEQKNVLEDLANGKLDIVIGTHKLLQKNVKFKNLGLLIVDEEHRFGVSQKEYIKSMATNVDILSLTATPIPRTLNMAFAGIRDFSIISTPPAKRLTIKTLVCEQEPYLIKEAILREIFRGGQVYFIHNNIMTIEGAAQKLKRLVPEARIAVAHGQMRKKELEKIMKSFYQLESNILVCTTIIESGIDIPTANTIIINRADNFGLAQLHQLRGRVGRSHHQAYAYLVIPPFSALSKDAKKRIEAIVAMKDLGTGFVLATNDLEIRGAGELLGEKQSGVMQGIGFTLYMDMLKSAINALKEGGDIKAKVSSKTEIKLQISALIPDKYLGDVNARLVLYKRIAEAENIDALDDLQLEMIDRFGLLPEPTKNLFKVTELKLTAQKLGIARINFGTKKGIIEFMPEYKGDIKTIIPLMQKHVDDFKFSSSNSIEFIYKQEVSRIDFIDSLLTEWVSES